MKNREKFAKEIMDIACNGSIIAIKNGTNTPIPCKVLECKDCAFHYDCEKKVKQWSEAEYEEPKITIPPDTPVDTKVIVSRDGKDWTKRHLKEVKDNMVIAFEFGRTSWTSASNYDVMLWEYGKLAEESDGT